MSDAQATMTQTAQVIGTAQYLSPEQARGERVDSRSDLYSAGCLLYELLTGRPPFTGDSPVAIAYQHVRENPIPPSQIDPDVPAWADAIVLRAMAKAPADRYQTAADMRADLQRAASGLPVAAAPPTRVDMYGGAQRMTTDAMMAGRTSQIPPAADYDYTDGYGTDGHRGRYRWVPWVLGLLVVLGVVIGVAYYLLAGGKTASVPLVNGQPVATAEKDIASAGLRSAVVDEASSSVQKGLVINSNPQQGNNVAPNTLVTLYVSKGAAPIAVPNVQGKQVNEAETTLQNDGFTVTTQQDTTSTQPSGTVVSQNPGPGTLAPPGSKVTLFVSGAANVPNVVGLSAQSATASLQSAGFKVNVQTVAGPANTTPGNVWQQNPGSNATAAPGTTVTILVQPAATQSPTAPPTSPGGSPTGSPGFGGGGGF
jgi:eukaryotic-like serine/threonine-protein kinase